MVETLRQPLEVNGVGKHPQHCYEDWTIPIGTQEIQQEAENLGSINTFSAPVIPDSHVPGLLGNESLRKLDAIMEIGRGKLHLPGPGYQELELPTGTKSFNLRLTSIGSCHARASSRRPRTRLRATPSTGCSRRTTRLRWQRVRRLLPAVVCALALPPEAQVHLRRWAPRKGQHLGRRRIR